MGQPFQRSGPIKSAMVAPAIRMKGLIAGSLNGGPQMVRHLISIVGGNQHLTTGHRGEEADAGDVEEELQDGDEAAAGEEAGQSLAGFVRARYMARTKGFMAW